MDDALGLTTPSTDAVADEPGSSFAQHCLEALVVLPGAEHVVVVDEDIDPFDMLQVEWAINTRVQPDRDRA